MTWTVRVTEKIPVWHSKNWCHVNIKVVQNQCSRDQVTVISLILLSITDCLELVKLLKSLELSPQVFYVRSNNGRLISNFTLNRTFTHWDKLGSGSFPFRLQFMSIFCVFSFRFNWVFIGYFDTSVVSFLQFANAVRIPLCTLDTNDFCEIYSIFW